MSRLDTSDIHPTNRGDPAPRSTELNRAGSRKGRAKESKVRKTRLKLWPVASA